MSRNTATSFNEWVEGNAERLRQRLSLYTMIDEDAFQDAYLSLATTSKRKQEASFFERTFVEIYRQLVRKNLNESYSTAHPDELFFSLIPADEAGHETEPDAPRASKNLIMTIQKHIRSTFSQREVTAWNMRLEGHSYRDITDVVDMGTTAINNTLRRIANETRAQFSYAL